MTNMLDNYRGKRGWGRIMPILASGVIPLALIGYTAKPALDFGRLSENLVAARTRSQHASELREFLAAFGEAGPPTKKYRRMEALLVQRMPSSFEPTDFYATSLAAARGLDLELNTIVPTSGEDLGVPVGGLSIFERRATLKGRARTDRLIPFLRAMHREGQPVCVHACRLFSLADRPGVFDFQLDLGVFYLSPPVIPEDEFLEDS